MRGDAEDLRNNTFAQILDKYMRIWRNMSHRLSKLMAHILT